MSERRRPAAFRALLTEASAAFAAGEHETGARRLREAWRETCDPTLAEAYEQLVTPEVELALAGTRDAGSGRAAAFGALAAGDPGNPLILAQLLTTPPDPELPKLERLRLLRAWTPDPLLAAGLARDLCLPLVPASEVGAHGLRIAIIRALAAQRDPRQLETLHALALEPGLSAETRRQLRGAIASLEQLRVRPLDERARAAFAPIARRVEARRARERRGAELLGAVLAAPELDEPRLVYADWLSARGDPRGEFITLQISRARSPSSTPGVPSERELELERRYGPRWAAPLGAVLNPHSLVFERGFLAQASIEAGQLRGPILDSQTWATLRVLDGHVPELLLFHGRLEALETLYGFLDLERFTALRAGGQLQRVSSYECSLADPNLDFSTPLGLRALLVRRALDERLRALLAAPACRGLEEFAIYYELRSARAPADHRERPLLRGRYELLADALPEHVRRLRMLDARTSRASRPQLIELLFERNHEDGAFDRLTIIAHPLDAAGEDQAPVLAALDGVLDSFADLSWRHVELSVRPPLRGALFERRLTPFTRDRSGSGRG